MVEVELLCCCILIGNYNQSSSWFLGSDEPRLQKVGNDIKLARYFWDYTGGNGVVGGIGIFSLMINHRQMLVQLLATNHNGKSGMVSINVILLALSVESKIHKVGQLSIFWLLIAAVRQQRKTVPRGTNALD